MINKRILAILYLVTSGFLITICILNIKTEDFLFMAICGAMAILLFIAGYETLKNLRKASKKKTEKKKTVSKNPYKNGTIDTKKAKKNKSKQK